MRYFLASVALLIAWTSPTRTVRTDKNAALGVVFVETLDVRGALISAGTGFLLKPENLVVTSHHVIQGGHAAQITNASGTVFAVKSVVSTDCAADLSLLAADYRPSADDALQLDASIPIQGEIVTIPGYSGGYYSTRSGWVSALVTVDKGTRIDLTIMSSLGPGSSGSPLLNEDGRVVGVVKSRFGNSLNVYYAASAESVHELLTRAGPGSFDSCAESSASAH